MFFTDLSRFRFIMLDSTNQRLPVASCGRARNGTAKRAGSGFLN